MHLYCASLNIGARLAFQAFARSRLLPSATRLQMIEAYRMSGQSHVDLSNIRFNETARTGQIIEPLFHAVQNGSPFQHGRKQLVELLGCHLAALLLAIDEKCRRRVDVEFLGGAIADFVDLLIE